MKNLRLIGFTSAALIASSAAVLGACSSEDTMVSASTDGGGAPETSTSDTGTDTGADGGVVDGSTDSPPDAPVETDAGLTLLKFADQVADAMCSTLSRCCYGDAKLDGGAPVDGGGTYDRAKCVGLFTASGFEGSLRGFGGLAGKAALDQTSGADCLQKINALTCNLAGPEFDAARTACFAALRGTQAAAQPCSHSIDCAPGNFCDAPDGVTGTCAPLHAINGGCATFNTGNQNTDLSLADEVCSYRASGTPKLFCDTIDFAAGVRPTVDWKCAAALPNGSNCANSLWCNAGICDPDTNICSSPERYFPMSFCSTFVKP
jgi:hypothetical protein